jgi:hypothetical protein
VIIQYVLMVAKLVFTELRCMGTRLSALSGQRKHQAFMTQCATLRILSLISTAKLAQEASISLLPTRELAINVPPASIRKKVPLIALRSRQACNPLGLTSPVIALLENSQLLGRLKGARNALLPRMAILLACRPVKSALKTALAMALATNLPTWHQAPASGAQAAVQPLFISVPQ